MASSEPKTRKSTMPAARMPMGRPPALGWLARSMAWPPRATVSPGPAADWATETTRLTASTGSRLAWASKLTVA